MGAIAERLEVRKDRKGPSDISDVSVIAQRRWRAPAQLLHEKAAYRPKTLAGVADALEALAPINWSGATDSPGRFKVHIVQPGDSLRALAQKYYDDVEKCELIFEANSWLLADADHIYVGQALRIPGVAP